MTTRTPDPVEYIHHHENADGKGGVCLYAWHWSGNSFFEVATTICSRDDDYDQKLADEMVRAHAMDYNMIRLPIDPRMDRFHLTQDQLETMLLTSIVCKW